MMKGSDSGMKPEGGKLRGLGVALASSRRLPDILWAMFAAAGAILLAPFQGVRIDPMGVGLALLAAGCWAAYILLSVRVGRIFPA